MNHVTNPAGREGSGAQQRLLEAAETCLLRDGIASLSTRSVAQVAGCPLSQIHYHFGSKQGLVLALLDYQNTKLLARQAATFASGAPLSQRWLQACDFLEEDLRSGYVRVLQEIVAAGFSDTELASAARNVLSGWFVLLTDLATEAQTYYSALGRLRPLELATLAGLAFLGAESMILIGMDLPIIQSLRALARVLEEVERDHAR